MLKQAKTGRLWLWPLTRQMPETPPTLALRAKKIPTDKGWDFSDWWSRGDLNPRPPVLRCRFYMLSRVY